MYAVTKLHRLNLDALLIAVCLLRILGLWATRRVSPLARAGAMLGLAVLSRPTLGLFGPVAVGWVWWARGAGPSRR